MKKIVFLSSFLLSFSLFSQQKQPNILIFLVDDMGWQDTSVPFWHKVTENNKKYHTPQMERLANQGMKFTQGYASSVCSPSRVSLITGTNPARHKVTNWTLKANTPTDVNNDKLIPPLWNVNGIATEKNQPLAFHATTLPQVLKNAGYHTILVGKAHFGAKDTPGENPINLGFDVNISGHAGGGLACYSGLKNFGNIDDKEKQSPFAIPDLEAYWGKDISVTEALTQEAISTLKNRPKNKPFFLYLSHYAVHTPIEADPRFVQKYLDKGYDATEAKYASMVEAMDKSLGDILNFLEENKLDNTLILFLSDNGGLSALARGGKPHWHNFPLQSGKGSAYEGGVRIPIIARWKGKIKENSENNSLISIEDIFPTLLEAAHIKTKTIQPIDGVSFTKTFNGGKINKNRPLFWHIPNNWYNIEGYGIGASSSIRLGDWKLIYMHKTQTFELFNLKQDISETQNLLNIHPQIAKKLTRLLGNFLRKTKAQMPLEKETQEIIPYPNTKKIVFQKK